MKRFLLACLALMAIGIPLAIAQMGTWPPPAGFVAIYPPVGAAPVNCSITSATGSAQRIITAAQYKQGFILQVGANDSNTNPVYFSYTNTSPTAGASGVFTLNPSTSTTAGGSWTSPNNMPVGVDIWVIATAATAFKCLVW